MAIASVMRKTTVYCGIIYYFIYMVVVETRKVKPTGQRFVSLVVQNMLCIAA